MNKHLEKVKEVYDFIGSFSCHKEGSEIIAKYNDVPDVNVILDRSSEYGDLIVYISDYDYSSQLRATKVNATHHWRVEATVIDVELGAEHLALTASNYLEGYIIDEMEWDNIILELSNAFTQGGFPYQVFVERNNFNRNILDVWAIDGDAYSSVSFSIEESDGQQILHSMKLINYTTTDDTELFYLHPLADVKRGYA